VRNLAAMLDESLLSPDRLPAQLGMQRGPLVGIDLGDGEASVVQDQHRLAEQVLLRLTAIVDRSPSSTTLSGNSTDPVIER
jgi:hypothetical protein